MNRAVFLGLLLAAGCSSPKVDDVSPPDSADPFDIPVANADEDQIQRFRKGKSLFEVSFREPDGLGPLYIRAACSGCHPGAGMVPGLVEKMTFIDPDGRPSADQSRLPFGHTVRPQIAAGATTPIVAPNAPDLKTSIRFGPSVLGRGYLEAVADSEIERVAAAQSARTDRIEGSINHVVYASDTNPDSTFGAHRKGEVLIGRFGLKARIATLDDFSADALQGDMGMTCPLRPEELPNPDGLTDDDKPGVDVSADVVNDMATYLRLLAIPVRRGLTDRGRELFERLECGVCHVPSMRTRPDYPIPQLRSIDAAIFSDLLLHDMGLPLADGIADGEANWREWRTPPLIGLRFQRTFLHDGRALSIEEAIVQHAGAGSEASASVERFNALSEAERRELLQFVGAL